MNTADLRPLPLLIVLSITLTGCADGLDLTPEIEASLEESIETLEQYEEVPTRPLLVRHDLPYLDYTRVAHAGAPWLHHWVELRAAELPLIIGLEKALAQLPNPPSVVFTPDLTNRNVPVTLDHRGPFSQFLNLLAEASGYGWEERGGALYWMSEITRTYEIHRVPGDIDYSMATIEADDEALDTGGGGGDAAEITAAPESGSTITLEGGGTFWEDLETTLNTFMEGAAMPPSIDRSSGTVILRGPAHMVRKAGRYIEALNRWLARQVLLEVQLVNVTLTGERNIGIDWNLVQETATSALVASASGNFASDLVGASLGISLSDDATGGSNSIFAGSSIVIQALEGQGTTSVQNSPRIVALNGQAAQLQVLDDRNIIASRTTTVTGGLLNTQSQTIVPGLVSTGIALTILPKIVGERIFLQTSIQVSELVELRTEGAINEEVSLPHVRRNQFFQSARLTSGETLALGGLVTQIGSDADNQIPSTILGTHTKKYRNIETVLLITPTLLDRPAPDEELLR